MPARIFTAIVILLAAVWAVWPYGNLWFFARAVDAEDVAYIEEAVDWQGVRGHLKEDVRRALSAELAKDGEGDDAGEALARGALMMLGSAVAEGLIEIYATPRALMEILRGIAGAREGGEFMDSVSYAFFASPTQFRVHVRPPGNEGGEPLGLIFSFHDFRWVLTQIELPLDELDAGGSGKSPGAKDQEK